MKSWLTVLTTSSVLGGSAVGVAYDQGASDGVLVENRLSVTVNHLERSLASCDQDRGYEARQQVLRSALISAVRAELSLIDDDFTAAERSMHDARGQLVEVSASYGGDRRHGVERTIESLEAAQPALRRHDSAARMHLHAASDELERLLTM